jgi:hypothetical protein
MLKLFIILLCVSNVQASEWSSSNNPNKIVSNLNTAFHELPESGVLKDQRLGWPGSHWASYIGGIAHRWSAGNPQDFIYKLLSLAELRSLELHELAELSPAEKYDISNGDYSYPTVKKIFKQYSPRESEWHGICHGYAPAALNHPEPASVTVVNPDGLSIYFYSSDVAGLLSYYYANVATTPVTLIGNRCNYGANSRIPRRHQSNCDDLNAGAFHLVLTNKIGIEGIGFIADIDRYFEVWNHIAINFESRIVNDSPPTKDSAKGTARRVQIESIVTYAAAIAPKFDPVLNTEAAEYAQNTYQYFLDLDQKGNVIGGDWISDKRPDFVWSQNKAEFKNEWSPLNDIYRPASSILR